MENDCRNCKHAKDRYHDSCFCCYYGYIRSRPKKECLGWEKQEDEKEEKKE